jgi:GNAT superfamily N-acetyltransferase
MALSDEVRAFAETPDRYTEIPADGLVTRHDDGRVCIVQGPTFAVVSAPEVDEGEVATLVDEVRALVPAAKRPSWFVGPSARPPTIFDELVALGLEPPHDHVDVVHALAIASAPPGAGPGVEARRVDTFEDFVATSELRFEIFDIPEEKRELERQHYETYWVESQRIGIPVWFLATFEGRVAGSAGLIPSERGVFLIGGSTAPWARGHGVYRALVRARWDYAVARGTPALVTHAKPDSSYPILRRLGFEEVCRVRRLEDRSAVRDHP